MTDTSMMPDDNKPVGSQRTGGRSARVRQAVLESALSELCETGYAGFSMASVAKRAAVHETTVYRRWPRREELIADACMQLAESHLPVPDTGRLADDLRIALTNMMNLVDTPVGQMLISLGFSMRSMPEFRASGLAFWHARMRIGQRVFAQAIARGEWPAAYDQAEVFGELVGPLLARCFLLQETVTPAMIEGRVRVVMAMGEALRASGGEHDDRHAQQRDARSDQIPGRRTDAVNPP